MIDFQIAKDRRDGLLHATNISLCEESFIVSKEKRDKGNSRTVIFNVKEMFFVQRDGTGVFSQFAIIWWLHLQYVMFFVKVWSCTGHL